MDRQFKFVQHLGPRFVTCEVKYSWFGCWCFSFVLCAFFYPENWGKMLAPILRSILFGECNKT